MIIDFFFALLTGWFILFIFWLLILIFIYFRKPPKSKLTNKIALQSLLIFITSFIFLVFFYLSIRF